MTGEGKPMTSYYCDLDWHNDAQVPADYLIRAAGPGADDPLIEGDLFSVCAVHAETALGLMCRRWQTVTVRIVNADG